MTEMKREPASEPDGSVEDRVARSRTRRAVADAEAEVPRIPRGKGFHVTRGQWIKIVLTGGLLVMLLVIQKPCADSVSSFVTSFDDPGSASSKMPKPGNVDGTGSATELIHGDMSEAEMRAAIDRARARAGLPPSTSGSGSGSAGAGSGSATGSGSAATRSGSGSGSGSAR